MPEQLTELSDMISRLTAWAQKKIPNAEDVSIPDMEKPGMGLSSETYFFDLNWREHGQNISKRVVLRSVPQIKVYPEYNVAHQFRIMNALKHTGVPVAKMLWLEEDASVIGNPFFLMERLEGEVPQDFPGYHSSGMYYDATPELRAKMWWGSLEAMVKIHKLDWKRLGLDFLGVPKGGTDAIDRQLAYWDRFLEWMKDDPQESHPIFESTLVWLKENRYAPEHMVLCWGDARMGNTLYSKPDRDVLAVMDWENAFIGDPESDLAWFFLLDRQNCEGFGVPRLEGTPSYEETVQRYEELTGWEVKNLFYNEVMAALRYGIAVTSSMKALIKKGIAITEDQIRDNLATRRLSRLLDLPSPVSKGTDAASIKDIMVFIQFHMTGPNGYDWYLLSDKGKGTRHEGIIENPTCTVTATADDWTAIQDGKLDRMEAWSSGRLLVDGDINAMVQLEDMIREFSKSR